MEIVSSVKLPLMVTYYSFSTISKRRKWCTSFSSLLTRLYRPYSIFIVFIVFNLHLCVCMYIILSSFIPCNKLCNPSKINCSKLFYDHKRTPSCQPFPIATTNPFSICIGLSFRECYINGIILNTMFLNYITEIWELVEVSGDIDENFNHDLVIIKTGWRTHKNSLYYILYFEILLIFFLIIIQN